MSPLQLFVVLLAALLGYTLVARVPSLFHAPLLAGLAAIAGITLVGAIIAAGAARDRATASFGFVAVVAAAAALVAGFINLDRMLRQFQRDHDSRRGSA